MKKTLIALTFAVTMLFASCGNSNETQENATNDSISVEMVDTVDTVVCDAPMIDTVDMTTAE